MKQKIITMTALFSVQVCLNMERGSMSAGHEGQYGSSQYKISKPGNHTQP